jgi:hypothetical protein
VTGAADIDTKARLDAALATFSSVVNRRIALRKRKVALLAMPDAVSTPQADLDIDEQRLAPATDGAPQHADAPTTFWRLWPGSWFSRTQ